MGGQIGGGSEVWGGLSGSQVCWTPPAAKASLILCLWGLQSLGLEGHWDRLGQGRAWGSRSLLDTDLGCVHSRFSLPRSLGGRCGPSGLLALVCLRGPLPVKQPMSEGKLAGLFIIHCLPWVATKTWSRCQEWVVG